MPHVHVSMSIDAFLDSLTIDEMRDIARMAKMRLDGTYAPKGTHFTRDEEVMLAAGRRIDAIKSVRFRLNIGLREAHAYVKEHDDISTKRRKTHA